MIVKMGYIYSRFFFKFNFIKSDLNAPYLFIVCLMFYIELMCWCFTQLLCVLGFY